MRATTHPAPTDADAPPPVASSPSLPSAASKARKQAAGKTGPRAARGSKAPAATTSSAAKTAPPRAKSPAAAPAPAPAKKATPRPRPAPARAAKAPVVAEKPKAKLVRDSFTMPQADFALIATLKDRALGFKRPTKKSELLRAGLQVLAALPVADLKGALERLAPLKTGRPKKHG